VCLVFTYFDMTSQMCIGSIVVGLCIRIQVMETRPLLLSEVELRFHRSYNSHLNIPLPGLSQRQEYMRNLAHHFVQVQEPQC